MERLSRLFGGAANCSLGHDNIPQSQAGKAGPLNDPELLGTRAALTARMKRERGQRSLASPLGVC